MSFWLIRILGVLLALFLAGCATPVSTNIKPSAASVAKYSDLSDLDAVATLEKNVNDARNANMPFLAPDGLETCIFVDIMPLMAVFRSIG